MKKYSKKYKKSYQSGFTLIELLVVIGIFTVITAVAFVNQGKLNSSVLLTNAAYETALATREAQVYGLGVRRDASNVNDNFEGEYGVHYSINNPRDIVVYSNLDTDTSSPPQIYNSTVNEARYLYQFVNQRGNKIQALCFGDLSATHNPCTTGSPLSVDNIDIVFKRPDPRATFYAYMNDGSKPQLSGTSEGPVYIVVSTVDNQNCKVVVVQKTGQIQVEGSDKGHCLPQ